MHKRWGARLCRVSSLGSVCALTVGCSGETADETSLASSEEQLSRRGSQEAALTSGASCGLLLERLQQNLLVQVEERAAQLRQNVPYYGGGVFVDDTPVVSPPLPAADGGSVDLSAEASVPLQGAGDAGFSSTTVQVEGVDEGDIVKAVGDRIYLLQNQQLHVLEAWPADATRLLSSASIEGYPNELLVEGDKVVVASTIYGELIGQGYSDYYYYYYPTYTKLTVLDVSGETPEVLRESYVEGYYSSSRRHGDVVRAVIGHEAKAQLEYPSIDYRDMFGNPYSQAQVDMQVDLWVQLVTDAILRSSLEDYLPVHVEVVDGVPVTQPFRCADHWLPAVGISQAGGTSVVGLDLAALDRPLSSTTVIGYAERVYANEDVVLISHYDYRYYNGQSSREQTLLHLFEVDGVDTRYAASGSVSGYIHSQFSLDEAGGIVRVSATERGAVPISFPAETSVPPPVPTSRVLTLGRRGRSLVELGRTRDFAQDEQIYATRFVGDRGYVVTFRLIDPLFVVDLSDPRAPTIVGELEIPGFSNLLVPLPDHHLFAIGQDADERGTPLGLALQIFDVRDPAAPRLAHKLVLEREGYSEAQSDHRSLTFHPDRDLLSMPYYDYTTGEQSLQVFAVSASDGIRHVGRVVPAADELSLEQCLYVMGYPRDAWFLEQLEQDPAYRESILASCQYYNRPYLRRGMFRDDVVFALSDREVSAHSLEDLEGPAIGRVELPITNYPGGVIAYPPGGFGGGSFEGLAGSGPMPVAEGGVAGTGAGGAPGSME